MGWKYLFYRVKTSADGVTIGETPDAILVRGEFSAHFFSLFWNFGTITDLFDWNYCLQCKKKLIILDLDGKDFKPVAGVRVIPWRLC